MKIQELAQDISISNYGLTVDNQPRIVSGFQNSFNRYELENLENHKFRSKEWEKKLSKDYLKIPSISAFKNIKESVCVEDDRVRVNNTSIFPWKMICKLFGTMNDGNRYVASGFFISPRCIITNGHVVFPNNSWATEIEVVPGMNDNVAPFGTDKSKDFRSVIGWTRDEKDEFDYGAIILGDTSLFEKVGAYFGYEQLNGLPVLNNGGYPADKPNGTMWYDSGKVTETTERMFKYMIDTSGGSSGSPVWGNDKRIAGVHGYGGCPNKAIRVISEVIKNWDYWKTL